MTPLLATVRSLAPTTREYAFLWYIGTSILVEGQQRLGEAKDGAGKAIMSGIDSADIKIEHQASKAKGGIKSWFGW